MDRARRSPSRGWCSIAANTVEQSGFGPAPFLLFQVVLSLEKGDGVFGSELSDPLAGTTGRLRSGP